MESDGNTIIIQLLDSSADYTDANSTPHIFEGTATNIDGYGTVRTLLSATQSGTLSMQQSMDCSTWDIIDNYDYPATDMSVNSNMFKNTIVKAKWYKTKFINTYSGNNDIRIQTYFHQNDMILEEITNIWESIDISIANVIETGKLKLHSVYGTKFIDANRYIKVYDISGTINTNIHTPKITIPLTTFNTESREFGDRGIIMHNGLQIRVTENVGTIDTSMGTDGDVLASLVYTK
uniref:Uncharacterized protein n=1 Tax=viral metagenome TaxID=1070528 RepID=A0A6C0J484_9ZZZZ